MAAEDSTRRHVAIDRTSAGTFTAINDRGGTIVVGGGTNFTPVELLLTAIAACTGMDVDVVTTRRAEPDSFRVEATANKTRDTLGSRLTDIAVTFQVRFPDGPDGDRAREILPDIVARSHDKLCTVSRTVELATPVTPRIE